MRPAVFPFNPFVPTRRAQYLAGEGETASVVDEHPPVGRGSEGLGRKQGEVKDGESGKLPQFGVHLA